MRPEWLYRLFFLVVFLFHLAFVGLVLPARGGALSLEFSTTVMPAIEIAFFCMLGLILLRYRKARFGWLARMVAAAIPLILMLIYLFQDYAMLLSGEYISELALENASESQYVAPLRLALFAAPGLVAWVALVWKLNTAETPARQRLSRRARAGAVALSILFVAMIDARSAPDDLVHFQPDLVPAISLARTFSDLFAARAEIAALTRAIESRRPDGVDADYPLMKTRVFEQPLPFPVRNPDGVRPNVIVILAEGFSARLMSEYGAKRSDLTPNLDALARKTMVVRNYYNHTAATFRGVKGQLVSGYPFYGGAMKGGWLDGGGQSVSRLSQLHQRSLADILSDRGYETLFLSPHKKRTPFSAMVASLGFSDVVSADQLPELLRAPELPNLPGTASATDAQMVNALIELLRQREQSSTRKPFFLGLYNIGTHAFLDVGPDGLRYGDGSNKALNRFHNFDDRFGRFIDWFFASPLARNTILIFTTDHAAFPEPAVKSALAADDYRQLFVDQIPLLVYSPFHDLPKEFDADYQTSVSLAPSVLHLLNINDEPNAFAGRSIFDGSDPDTAPVAALGYEFFLIAPGGPFAENSVPDDQRPWFEEARKFIRTYYALEMLDRVFPPPGTECPAGQGATLTAAGSAAPTGPCRW